jgi:hypothetical protein
MGQVSKAKRAVLGLAAGLSIVLAMGTEPGDAQAPQQPAAPAGPREVPARTLPIPTDVSPETAKIMAATGTSFPRLRKNGPPPRVEAVALPAALDPATRRCSTGSA